MDTDVWTIERHLMGKSEHICELYRQFVAIVEACGPVSYAVSKSAITFKGARRGFAGVKPKSQYLDGYLDLEREVTDSRILRSSPYTQRLYVHHFRVRVCAEMDDEFRAWIREAYAVGAGAHLTR
ncbi:hypothetical protein HIJ39_22270 [Sulfobacillus sp. DSM 109850]|uniref:DUF5655 domain-containing protein n=2 Tax=Sulfobacillus harzensis TaxID=2729629 RepID=A0A7Y0L9M1_9FIRM|nr:hypothetical protein [Sulfobacillus harzensis]